MPSIILQRFKCCQMLSNDVTRAHKGFFTPIMQTIQQKFEHLLQLEQDSVDFRNESHCTKTPQIIMDTANIGELFHDKWTKTLNQAVKDGEPADLQILTTIKFTP